MQREAKSVAYSTKAHANTCMEQVTKQKMKGAEAQSWLPSLQNCVGCLGQSRCIGSCTCPRMSTSPNPADVKHVLPSGLASTVCLPESLLQRTDEQYLNHKLSADRALWSSQHQNVLFRIYVSWSPLIACTYRRRKSLLKLLGTFCNLKSLMMYNGMKIMNECSSILLQECQQEAGRIKHTRLLLLCTPNKIVESHQQAWLPCSADKQEQRKCQE